MGFLDDVGGFIFGNSQDPGLLGLGMGAQAQPYYLGPDQGQTAYNQAQDTRSRQLNFIDMLQQQLLGTGGPSVAQQQLNQALSQNVGNQIGLAAANRGLNPAMAQKLAAQNIATVNQNAAGDGALLRAQEQLNLQNLIGTSLDSARGGDQSAQALGVQQQTGLNQLNQQAYDTAGKRRSEFISNIGSAIGGSMGGK